MCIYRYIISPYPPTPADARGNASRITGFCVAFLQDEKYSWKIGWCLAAAAAARPVSFSIYTLYYYGMIVF